MSNFADRRYHADAPLLRNKDSPEFQAFLREKRGLEVPLKVIEEKKIAYGGRFRPQVIVIVH